jgi:DNA polymerase
MDRALEAEAKALLRAARAWLEERVEEELAWTPSASVAMHAPALASAKPAVKRDRTPTANAARVSSAADATSASPASAPPPIATVAPPPGKGHPLDDVRARLGDCTRCPLHAGRTKIVFGDGNPSAELMFVGEGPGEQEDLSGLPFVGRAGELLTQMIEAGLKIPRASVYIANVVKCRPPNNRTPLPNEVAACREFLDGQIDAIRPRVIVALGKPATSLLLGRDVSITRVRGSWHDYRGYPVMPTFHPAFLLRQYTPENRRLVWQDLRAALERSRASTQEVDS